MATSNNKQIDKEQEVRIPGLSKGLDPRCQRAESAYPGTACDERRLVPGRATLLPPWSKGTAQILKLQNHKCQVTRYLRYSQWHSLIAYITYQAAKSLPCRLPAFVRMGQPQLQHQADVPFPPAGRFQIRRTKALFCLQVHHGWSCGAQTAC